MPHGRFEPVSDVTKIPTLEPGCKRLVQAVVDVDADVNGRCSLCGDGTGFGADAMRGALALLVARASMMSLQIRVSQYESLVKPGEEVNLGPIIAETTQMLQSALLGGLQQCLDQLAGKDHGINTVVQVKQGGGSIGSDGRGKTGG